MPVFCRSFLLYSVAALPVKNDYWPEKNSGFVIHYHDLICIENVQCMEIQKV